MKRKELISKVIFIIAVILFVVGLMQVKSIASSVEHTHIWATKYDSTNHWEYCTVCNQTRNVTKHSYTDKWILGSASCNSTNYSLRTCTCGYSYTYRMPHTPGTSYTHSGVRGYHQQNCTVCNSSVSVNDCSNSNGKLSCKNPGTCSICGNTAITSNVHHLQSNGACRDRKSTRLNSSH